MRRSILRIAVAVGAMLAVTLPSTQAMAAVTPATTAPTSSVESADCDGEDEKVWLESPDFGFVTINYRNCRDETVERRAYTVDFWTVYSPCEEVAPHSTVSWTISIFQMMRGWGVTTC